ncbi:hypothetical protein BUALT_Bualt02G0248300 [Buddleja alternifolia]|uniref:Pectinesterase n=1 Tax=Buddleja alternifolia TaxID=168488 RepID=A0AAV6Y5A8_9LAMI|nr:hypothetical protein BUALT_Bualt02G0248300 [Buddleja alternifolia]
MSASMKMITSICEGTSYKEMCARSLESAAKNSSATAKDYLLAAIHATVEEVKKGLEATGKVSVNKEADRSSHLAVEECKNFLDSALDSLNDTITSVMDSTTHTLEERAHELLSWVTAVHALHTTCLEFITNPEIKSAVENGINNATQLAHNAVNIIADLPEILSLFGLSNNDESSPSPSPSPSRRRLLLTDDGFPTWFSAADRKLLGKHNKGGGGSKGNKNKNNDHNGKDNTVYVANIANIKPNVVVAKDGSGNFKRISEAIAAYPANNNGRFIIYVKAGVYDEQVIIDKKKPNIFMYGDGIGKTIVTGNRIAGKNLDPSTTFSNEAFGFIARGMTFRNEAGPQGHRAVAFRSKGDKVALFDCSFEGNQDTFYYQVLRQFYRNCVIYGTIDFIFGKGDAVIQDSDIIVRKPMPNQFNTITADGKDIEKGSNGLVLHHCRIRPDNYLYPVRFDIKTYLGRPWSANALTVFMKCELADFIRPEGFRVWDNAQNHKTCQMFEFGNTGPGNKTDRRDSKNFSHWRVISPEEAAKYTPGQFIMGHDWLPQTGFPNRLGL